MAEKINESYKNLSLEREVTTMSDTQKAYKPNKEKQKAAEDGKFLYYFYDRHKLTSVALPEEKFDKLVAMDSE